MSALQKGRKLHGKLVFQGLPISIENKAGSRRYWYDPNADEHGSTKMKYPYGYIRGTLGTDGDAVDVFVGPDNTSEKVFVVTQMKRPEFRKVDEQKVMLGFNSSEEAKKAYLSHFNDPRFFGSMKEMSIDEFKSKVSSQKGKLIKHLFFDSASASIQATVAFSGGQHVSKSTIDLLKGLSSRMLSAMNSLKREEAPSASVDSGEEVVEVVMPVPSLAQSVVRPFEAPPAPTAHIMTPFTATSPSAYTVSSCPSCGYTHKSLNGCPRCEQLRQTNREATPIWRR